MPIYVYPNNANIIKVLLDGKKMEPGDALLQEGMYTEDLIP